MYSVRLFSTFLFLYNNINDEYKAKKKQKTIYYYKKEQKKIAKLK